MEELEQLKKVLRALVVSSPCQVDMFSLLRDYRQMMGGHLPAAKYGYREPLAFLKERCNDCFVFHGDPKNPTLTPIVTEQLKHIDKFVQNQKKSAAVKFKGKRRSIEPPRPPPAAQQQPDLVVKTFNKFTIKEDHSTTNNTSPIPESSVEDHNHKLQRTPDVIIRHSSKVPVQKSPEVTIHKSPEVRTRRSLENNKFPDTQNNYKPKNDSSSNAVHSFLKKKTSLYNSQYLDSESSVDGKSKDDDSGRQTASSNSIKKSIALEQLKDEVVELVASSAEGVWCTDLLRLYRERHGRELNFGRFGFTSIISLVSVLDARLRIARPDDTGDWLLQAAGGPPAAPLDAPPAAQPRLPRHKRPVNSHRAVCNVDPDDALPGIDFDPDVFPADCVHFMESIPVASLSALQPGALLDVMVGEVYSPSHFWLLRLGDQHHLAMERLMDEMTEYYSMGEGKDRYLAMGAVRVGHYCSSVFDRDWHRSLIVKIIDSDTVKVRHVDYGTVDRVPVRGLKPLLRRWAALPAQAVRARLAGVRPGAAGRRWPHAACTRFLDRVRDTKLVASLVAVDREEDILEVFLVNTSTEVDDDISADLIRSGHADPRHDSSVRVSPALHYSDDDEADVRSLLTAISQFHTDDTLSDVSASASELVGSEAKRLPTWECPTSDGSSPDTDELNSFLDTDFRSLLVGSCEESVITGNLRTLNAPPPVKAPLNDPTSPIKPRSSLIAKLLEKTCKDTSPPPADPAPTTPSPPRSVLLAKLRALHTSPQKPDKDVESEVSSDGSVATLATQTSRRLARIKALHAKIPASKFIPPTDSLSPGNSILAPNNPTQNPLSPSKPITSVHPVSNTTTLTTPTNPPQSHSASSSSGESVSTSVTSLVLRRRLALTNKLRNDALP